MTETHLLRSLATEFIDLLGTREIQEHEQIRSFVTEQQASLQTALKDSTTPEIYKVAVVGSFKVGKSSFVNALCGIKNLASANSNPETAAITRYHYSEQARLEAHLIELDQWEVLRRVYQEAPNDLRAARYRGLMEMVEAEGSKLRVADLERDLISEDGVIQQFFCPDWDNEKERKEFLSRLGKYVSRRDPLHFFVRQLVVYVPVPFLKDGIELIDTPGLDDPDRYRVVLTEECVQNIDAILFLTRSGNSYSQSDKDFIIRQLRCKTIKHLRLIITRCDETFENAKRDARNNDEDIPNFERHLDLERARIRSELERTLDEMLAARDISEDSKAYFRDQLVEIPIDFISSTFHLEGNKEQGGIDSLHSELMAMLQKSERVAKARKILVDGLSRVCDRTIRGLNARREAVTQDFSIERVKRQLEQVEAKLNEALVEFKRRIKKEVKLLNEENAKDGELVESKVDAVLLQCDSIVDQYCMKDVGLHWRTRRCRNWGSLDLIQHKVADSIFPNVEAILRRFMSRYEDAIRRIQGQIESFQQTLAKVEHDVHLEGNMEPVALTEMFGDRFQEFTEDVDELVSTSRDKIVRHLDSFVSEEVRASLDQAQSSVAEIWGIGTTGRQFSQVQSFYRQVKESLRGSLESHLQEQIKDFGQIVLNQADLIYPKIESELGLIIQDRLNAIQANLTDLNDHQKIALVESLQRVIKQGEKMAKKLRSVLATMQTGP